MRTLLFSLKRFSLPIFKRENIKPIRQHRNKERNVFKAIILSLKTDIVRYCIKERRKSDPLVLKGSGI